MLLYYPWCSECELKNGFSTYEEHYESIKDVVDHNVRHFKQHSEYIENAFEEQAENGPPESVWDAVAPTIEEDNVATRNEGFYAVRNLEEEDLAEHNQMMLESRDENSDIVLNKSVLSMLYTKEARKDIMTAADYQQCLRNLNDGQREIVMFNRMWCKKAVHAL